MTPIRRPSSSDRARGALALLALVSCAACGGGSPSALSTPNPSADEPKRKPDGVLLEPAPAVPVAVERADARGVVALKQGLSLEEIRTVVRQLMRAYENEQPDGVNVLLTPDATDLYARWGRDQILAKLRERFGRLEYQKMRGLDVAHVERAEVREFDDLLPTGARARPADMAPGDVVVRVPMTAPMSNGERLFDDVLVLMLRREKGQLKIAGIGETGT